MHYTKGFWKAWVTTRNDCCIKRTYIHKTTAISSCLPGFTEVYVYIFTCTCNIMQIKQLFKSLTVTLDTLYSK